MLDLLACHGFALILNIEMLSDVVTVEFTLDRCTNFTAMVLLFGKLIHIWVLPKSKSSSYSSLLNTLGLWTTSIFHQVSFLFDKLLRFI